MTKWALFSAFVGGQKLTLKKDGHEHSNYVDSIQREDGSGKCFNVTLIGGVKVFVRTID